MSMLLTLSAALLLAQAPAIQTPATQAPPAEVTVVAQQTVDGIGACQGIALHDGYVWLYGDAETGVVQRHAWNPDTPGLDFTGMTLRLTVGDEDTVPHPTGLTFHPRHGCVMGNTVGGVGTIRFIDWPALVRDGHLDDAVLHTVKDDAAVNGTRPEFVRYRGRWVIATSDYGPEGNHVRLYDPVALRGAERTSDTGVLIAEFPCGPFVQTLHWLDEAGLLFLVQNQTPGLGYRLTVVDLESTEDLREVTPIDLGFPEDELEGFAVVAEGWAVMSSAMRENNVTAARWLPLEFDR